MLQYLIKRVFLLCLTLFGIMVLTFLVTRLTPGDPALLQAQSESSARQGGAALDDLIERNRRNLGLDRPLFVNFREQGPRGRANEAINDLFRRAEFWNRNGERRLQRMSTLALETALDRYALIGSEGEPEVRDSDGKIVELSPVDARKARMAALLPRLAPGAPRSTETNPDAIHQHYLNWWQSNRTFFAPDAVKERVAGYLDGSVSLNDITATGGYAIPHLMKALRRGSVETIERVNQALEVQTGFVYLIDATEPEDRASELASRWQSWWLRDGAAYIQPNAGQKAWNVIFDTQFGLWVQQVASLDFGESYSKRKPVTSLFKEALPISLLLSATSILLAYIIAIPLGIFSALKRRTKSDAAITLILFILYSLPSFWVAGILILFFTGPPFISAFPVRGIGGDPDQTFIQFVIDRMWHLVLPVFCLTYGSLAYISRQMRSSLLETISQDYIRTARAKGLDPKAVVLRHALRNSLIPILTISASILPELIAGAIIIESIFTIPGMGTLTFEAIVNRDYPIINAVVFFSAFLTLLGILIVDLSYALVDPRITYDEASQ